MTIEHYQVNLTTPISTMNEIKGSRFEQQQQGRAELESHSVTWHDLNQRKDCAPYELSSGLLHTNDVVLLDLNALMRTSMAEYAPSPAKAKAPPVYNTLNTLTYHRRAMKPRIIRLKPLSRRFVWPVAGS